MSITLRKWKLRAQRHFTAVRLREWSELKNTNPFDKAPKLSSTFGCLDRFCLTRDLAANGGKMFTAVEIDSFEEQSWERQNYNSFKGQLFSKDKSFPCVFGVEANAPQHASVWLL
ncbi:hypothetical protein V1279_001988 [Bradyrhizobium sp. AZCC 1610]|uniref:hypothetical protein n=1 Tax=Bradyrhizobium sp. AZCC 1610 TaxID=3117020 RepID=UPI002FF06BBC